MSYVLVFLILGIVIFVHEFGHYLAMRMCGVTVPEFTVGFGPKLWSTRLKNGTVFSVRAFLLGGYTKPKSVKGRGAEENLSPDCIEAKSRLQTVFIYSAGMIANVLFAIPVLILGYSLLGAFPAVIAPWVLWAPAKYQPTVAAVVAPIHMWLTTPIMLVKLVINLKVMLASVAGPVGIVAYGGGAIAAAPDAWHSIGEIASFVGLICGALAGFNLIPIVPLDGGRIAEIGLRGLFGHRAAYVFQVAGMLFFLFLIVVCFSADGIRVFDAIRNALTH